MYKFKIELADRVIEINSVHSDVFDLCREYLVDDSITEDFSVSTDNSDIEYERIANEDYERKNKLPHTDFSDAYIETLVVYRKIVTKLVNYNIVLFHGSAVAIDGEAYLFTALSGTGKSTHRRLWQQVYGERVTVINDDKPLVRVDGDRAYIYGTPWDGKHHVSTNTSVRLKAICVLERGETNQISQITFREALPQLMMQFYRPEDKMCWAKTLASVERIAHSVEFYRLSCNMEPDAAMVAYEGMK